MRTPEEIASEWSASNRAIVLAAIRSRDAEHAATIRLLARHIRAINRFEDESRCMENNCGSVNEYREVLATRYAIDAAGLDLDELSKEAE